MILPTGYINQFSFKAYFTPNRGKAESPMPKSIPPKPYRRQTRSRTSIHPNEGDTKTGFPEIEQPENESEDEDEIVSALELMAEVAADEPDAATLASIEQEQQQEEQAAAAAVRVEETAAVGQVLPSVSVRETFFTHLTTDDAVAMYLHEMGQTPLLARSEEVVLGQLLTEGVESADRLLAASGHYDEGQLHQLRSGNYISGRADLAVDEQKVLAGEVAYRRLVQANLRLVVSVARKYQERGLNLLDLLQEGNIGLMKAARKYDYRLGFKFSTYATWWIRQAITRAISDQSRLIRLPVHVGELLNAIRTQSLELQRELGREPTVEELAARLEITPTRLALVRKMTQQPTSLDMPIGEEGDTTLGDLVEDTASFGEVERAGQQSMLREEIEQALSQLTPKEAQILRLRYGLESDGQPRTLEEVAQIWGISRERVRQIEAKAFRKLRHPRVGKQLKMYLQG